MEFCVIGLMETLRLLVFVLLFVLESCFHNKKFNKKSIKLKYLLTIIKNV